MLISPSGRLAIGLQRPHRSKEATEFETEMTVIRPCGIPRATGSGSRDLLMDLDIGMRDARSPATSVANQWTGGFQNPSGAAGPWRPSGSLIVLPSLRKFNRREDFHPIVDVAGSLRIFSLSEM